MIIKNAAKGASFHADRMGKVDLAHGEHLFSGLNCFRAGQVHEPHVHCDRDKIYVVLSGRGDVRVGDATDTIEPGDVALAPAGVEHSLANPGPDDLVVMVVMGPPPPAKS